MADIEQFFTNYKKYHSTFKETSYDDKKSIYLCTDTSQDVINFDSMVQEKYIKQEKTPKSFDAIYFLHNTLYLIEFKNQIPSNINNKDVQEKLISGKKELDTFLTSCNVQKNDYSFKYCVVYKNFKKPTDRYKRGVSKNIIEFGLNNCLHLVNAIKTDSVLDFTKLLSKNITPKMLNCENS